MRAYKDKMERGSLLHDIRIGREKRCAYLVNVQNREFYDIIHYR